MSVRQFFETERYQYCLVAAALIVAVIAIEIRGAWGDVDHYWVNISEVLIDHRMPYSDTHFEYPPVALAIFAVPRLLSWDLNSFRYVYAAFAGLTYLVTMRYAFRIGDRFGISRVRIFTVYFLSALWLNQFIVARYDIFPVLTILMAVDAYFRGKHDLAAVFLAVGTMMKLFPALAVFALIYPLIARREWFKALRCFVILVLGCVAIMLPFMINDFSTAFSWLTIHSARGIQVESVVGTIMEVGSYFAPGSVTMINNYGSDNITGDIPDAVAAYMNYVMVAGVLMVLLLMLHAALRKEHTMQELDRNVVITSLALILAFIVFNKVYSAQYGLWAIAMVPLLYYPTEPKLDDKKFIVIVHAFGWLTFIAAMAYKISIEVYGRYEILSALSLIELSKNIATVVLFIAVLKLFWMQFGPEGTREEASE